MALDKDGITKLPKGISYRSDKDLYMGRFMMQGESFTFYHSDLKVLQKMMNDKKYEVEHGLFAKQGNCTLNFWYETWIEWKKPHVKQGTIDCYNMTYKEYIQNKFGSRRVKNLKTEHIQNLCNELAKEYSKETLKLVKSVLNGMYKLAVKKGIVIKNPVTAVDLPRCKVNKRERVPSREEQDLFLKYARGTYCELLFQFAICTGLRIGEIRALRWNDIDYRNQQISVRGTLKFKKGTGYWIDTPKTSTSEREVYMLPRVLTILEQVKKNQIHMEQLAGQYWNPDAELGDLIFTTETGKPLSHTRVNVEVKKIEARMQEDGVNVPHVTPHTFRHIFATRAFENGISEKVVQELLGHSSLNMTMNVYSHVLPEIKAREMQKLKDIV